LLDDKRSIGQLANLERRVGRAGRDTIDHPRGSKNDVANAIAGLSHLIASEHSAAGGNVSVGMMAAQYGDNAEIYWFDDERPRARVNYAPLNENQRERQRAENSDWSARGRGGH
jgi:hypothetical protein